VLAVALVVGTTLLGLSLATTPGDSAFYPLTLAVAAVWAIGGLASGPVPLGCGASRGRALGAAVGIGVAAVAAFVVGALVIREIEPLRSAIAGVLAHARRDNLALGYVVTLLNGAAEEVFFRGALYAAVGPRHAVLISVAIYVLVTAATGNGLLVFAALIMGLLWTWQRRASGGIAAPMVTHVIWSAGILLTLPPIIGS
jgi:membrane protease YdiL (CAAX protease family)